MKKPFKLYQVLIYVVLICALLLIYLSTFQTIPNGSSHLTMIDVGETQIVLNTWGTLHSTGYPLYVMIGNIVTILIKALGISPATAPAIVSLIWGIASLIVLYALVLNLTQKRYLALAMVMVFGLTRFVWLHNVIAEIYSFTLLFTISLLTLALWKDKVAYRISLLAFIGGLGVAHHRGVGLIAPALIYAVWPQLRQEIRERPIRLVGWIILGLVGFIPYLYLPLRARAGASWVYGSPRDWQGFWDQFSGQEAGYLMGLPDSSEKLINNFHRVNELLIKELSLPTIIIGFLGLFLSLMSPSQRRVRITFILSALASYLFSTVLYFDILAPLILTITLSFLVGSMLLLNQILDYPRVQDRQVLKATYVFISILILGYGVWLHQQNYSWIKSVTHDETGLETITMAQNSPENSTLMMAWGPRYFAIGFAKDVEDKLTGIEITDHRGDFSRIMQDSRLITPEYTFYNQTLDWWRDRLGQEVYLRAVAPYLVEIGAEPQIWDGENPTIGEIPIVPLDYALQCDGEFTTLYVEWMASEVFERNLSIMVHLLDQNGNQLAEADQYAPVYGWRPVTSWVKNEVVQDVYPLPQIGNVSQVRFGLYEQLDNGEFINYYITYVPFVCEE